ncbi:MAG TPA: hypothetical protein VF546_17120 [Pyrinomonadaceae bacterium]|jgi:hypothetical protein
MSNDQTQTGPREPAHAYRFDRTGGWPEQGGDAPGDEAPWADDISSDRPGDAIKDGGYDSDGADRDDLYGDEDNPDTRSYDGLYGDEDIPERDDGGAVG